MKTNEELLAEANKIEFKFTAQGNISRSHSPLELGLYIIKRAIEIHGIDRYLYGKVRYINAKTKITIVCPMHGDFEITPNSHISGRGCPQCHNVKKPSTAEWVEKAQLVHGDKYDYSQVSYKNAKEKVQILCLQHGPFYQAPYSHLSGSGCLKCGHHNHNILYLLKCKETGWYKIGITTGDTKRRIKQIGGNVEDVFHVSIEDPRKHESILHQKYREVRKTNLYVDEGNTEFFSFTEEQVQEVINYMKEL